jgi:hypothetical protein
MADDLLIAMIIAGFGLVGAYFRAEYVSWHRYKAAERRKLFSPRELYANHVCDKKRDASVSAAGDDAPLDPFRGPPDCAFACLLRAFVRIQST